MTSDRDRERAAALRREATRLRGNVYCGNLPVGFVAIVCVTTPGAGVFGFLYLMGLGATLLWLVKCWQDVSRWRQLEREADALDSETPAPR